MEWKESKIIPEECINCQEEDCYNCDIAGNRWELSQADKLRLKRNGLLKAMERMARQIREIEEQLEVLENG